MKIINVADTGGIQVNTAFMKENYSSTTKLTGSEAFTFDYNVEWPLSLVISRKSLTKYQLIFRHLFLCKHVERQLGAAWSYHQSTRELDLRRALASSYRVRQRMTHFLQNLEYYIMYEVLEPNWCTMEQNVRKASTIDEVLKYHSDFQDTCLTMMMLTDPNLVKVMIFIIHQLIL
jgi:gamma-tubulin complex component 2